MNVKEKLQEVLGGDSSHTVMWIVAFAGVCVLVGIGKLKPDTIEYLLFAMGGASIGAAKKPAKAVSETSEGEGK